MGRIVTSNNPVYAELGITSPTAIEADVVTAQILRAEGAVRRFLKYDPVQVERTEYYPRAASITIPTEMILEANDTEAYFRSLGNSAQDELQLQHIPVRSISALYIDIDGRAGQKAGAFAAGTLKTAGTDYWLNMDGTDDSGGGFCTDGIVRSLGLWPIEPGSIKIVYMAGYSASEFVGESIVDASPIYYSVIDEAARTARRVLSMKKHAIAGVLSGSLSSERMGDYSYSVNAASGADMSKFTDLHPATRQRLADFVNYGVVLSS